MEQGNVEFWHIIDEFPNNPGILTCINILRQARPDYTQYSEADCFKMAEILFKYWVSVLSRDPRLLQASADTDASWREASFYIATHFLPALAGAEKLLLEPDAHARAPSGWFPFTKHGINGMANLCSAEYGFDAAVERRMLSEYLSGVWDSNFMTIVGSPVLGRTPVSWDEFVYWTFKSIGEVALASAKREHLMLAALLTRGLAVRCKAAVHARDKNDFRFRNASAGSLVIIDELHSLATRTASAIERYGESEIEVRFEAQLSLLMQSFGFIVVRTQRGQRRVDLICIAPSLPEQAFTLLVEAKTTAHNYSLPTRDARGIAEYAASVRSVLKALPPLRLILVVSGSPTKTMERKLAALETECGVAVRYCNVLLLRYLRQGIPGPIDFSRFLKVCISSERVMTSQGITAIVEADKAIRIAHSDFINRLLTESSQ